MLQDSLVREVALEQKLIDLQKLLSTIRESVDENWKVRISEDRLLSKIEVLENQLQIYSKVSVKYSYHTKDFSC